MAVTGHPTTLIIFGATGNLAETKIYPGLVDLSAEGHLPPDFEVVAFARKPFDDSSYRALVGGWISAARPGKEKEAERLLRHTRYVQGDFDSDDSYRALGRSLAVLDHDVYKGCSNKLFYLAVPPSLYEGILEKVSSSGLSIPCSDATGWTRILIEKPFGRDLATARALDRLLGRLFKEEQIFRIDHYLAKETIQNILAFRLVNEIFDPLWNGRYIEGVDILFSESKGVGSRVAFYDSVGALKDVGQNHMLQMLALIAMERPAVFDAAGVRAARAKALRSIRPARASAVARGQYEGYASEALGAAASGTETAFAVRTELDDPRWAGVPFTLIHGKGFADSVGEIRVRFKKPGMYAFGGDSSGNELVFRIQPKDEIELRFLAKRPGAAMDLERRNLSFSYPEGGPRGFEAYAKVLYDCIRGDQMLFASTDEVEASWTFVASIVEVWEKSPMGSYKKGISLPEWGARSLEGPAP